MGKNLFENFPVAARLFEELDDALDFRFPHCALKEPPGLQLTENTQPAILSVSVAAIRTMEAEGFPRQIMWPP